MKKKKIILGAIIAFFLIYFLIEQIDLEKLHDIKIVFNYHSLIGASILYIITNFIRSMRFNYVLENRLKLIEMFRITSFYNLYTGLFPGGIGELSFVYLIKRKIKKHVPLGLSSLMITRIYDILTITIFCIMSLLIIGNIFMNRTICLLIFIIIMIVIFFIIKYLAFIMEHLGRILCFFLKKNNIWYKKIKENFQLIVYNLRTNRSKNIPIFFITFLYWGVNFFVIQLFFLSIGLRMDYFESILLGTISNFVATIPVNTFGGFGYKEAGITLGLVLMGIARNEAVIFSFLFHLLSIAFLLMLAFIGIIVGLKFRRAKERVPID